MEEIKECRVCLGSEKQESLFSPCLCKGSQSYIHEECLVLMRNTNEKFFYQCPTCKYNYKFSDNFLLKFLLREESLIVISLCLSFFILGIIAGAIKLLYYRRKINSLRYAMIFLSILGTPSLIYFNGNFEHLYPIFNLEGSFIYFLYSMHVLTKNFIRTHVKFENKVQPNNA